MTKVSKSPQRNTFQKKGYLERQAEKGLTPDNDENTRKMVEWYETWDAQDDVWANQVQKDDLEYDLRTTDWILEKVRTRKEYAQNLYAAMCNMQFVKTEMWPILKEDYWSASWRSAGGIIANMRQEGDYIDWYCSGMGGLSGGYDPDDDETFEQWQIRTKYVPEGTVTTEVEEDLRRLGWMPVPYKDED